MRVNKTDGYSINIIKKEDADIIKTINNVNKFLEENKNIIPENIEISVMGNNSRTINDLLNAVTSNIAGGFVIIFLILIIFLDFKSAIFTSLGMIIVISVSMIYMKYSNITFNTISLAGIITVLGMIVDNSIVVSENIFNYHQKGFKGLDATKSAVGEVFMPMLVSTLTTVAAFTPMIFVSGTMGILLLPNNLITKDNLKTLTGMDAIIYKVHKKKNPLDFDKDKLFNILKIPFKKLLTFTLKIRYLIIILK